MGGVYLAFTKYNYVDGIFGSPFVGMDNFRFLYISGNLFNITKNTVLYNIAFLLTGNLCQIAVAIFISEIPGRLFKKVSQSLMFLPYFVSFVLVGLVVYNILNYETGLLNTILKSLNFEPIDVYGNVGAWKYILVLFNIWKGIGYGSVIYLAAIMGIDREMYEAATIDSANIFQQIRYITLPMLKPTFIVLVLLQLGNILRGQFELFYQIIGSNGTLYKATDIIDTYVFRALVNSFDIGMGTAVGLYQSFFGFVLIMTVNTIVKKVSPDYALF
jgi:putative aldouronate transport system permease protein